VQDLSSDVQLSVRRGKTRELRKRLRTAPDFEARFALAQDVFAPGPAQNEQEIAAFLEFAARHRPRVVCEIGTQDGGNLFLLGAHLTTVDLLVGIDLHVRHKALLRRVLDRRRPPVFVEGSSYAERTAARVRRALGGLPIDLLFIDGDHSYGGAVRDYLIYGPLVRDGGLIAFHDIVPDGRRGGAPSDAYAGDIPVLWLELKRQFDHAEFIADRHQLGRGIGVLVHRRGARAAVRAPLPDPSPP
jgi:predicted O-methyltransferase YrrM